jgi:hypothetical protein
MKKDIVGIFFNRIILLGIVVDTYVKEGEDSKIIIETIKFSETMKTEIKTIIFNTPVIGAFIEKNIEKGDVVHITGIYQMDNFTTNNARTLAFADKDGCELRNKKNESLVVLGEEICIVNGKSSSYLFLSPKQ